MRRKKSLISKILVLAPFMFLPIFLCASKAAPLSKTHKLINAKRSQILSNYDASLAEIFSCNLESGFSVKIYLDLDHKSLYMNDNSNKSKLLPQRIDEPEQTIGANAHGYSTIISGVIGDNRQTIFIDTNPNDPSMAAITDRKKTRFCANTKFHTKSYHIRPYRARINIFSLLDLGVTTQLESPPEWPSS